MWSPRADPQRRGTRDRRRAAPQCARHGASVPGQGHGDALVLSFIIAALIVYWSGWSTVSWLLGLQILMFAVYLLCALRAGPCAMETSSNRCARQPG